DLAVASLSPLSTRMQELMQDVAEIDRILGRGAERAEAIATPIMERCYEIVGMVRSRR
ncbi:MAG TPA: tryptophan--tRNA ligase, partial [Paracoccus sp.]|nr:tryptophan--tRNA ligase [Paracoccus sp. (in: a-proteobacteria)]